MVTFSTKLASDGGNNTGIVVPQDVLESLNRGKKPPVTVKINDDYTYRSTVATMNGQAMIPFSAAIRKDTGVGAGDEISVTLEIDDAPRNVVIPDVLKGASADPLALEERWDKLAPSKQKAYALQIDSAKTDETRDRRIAKILSELEG